MSASLPDDLLTGGAELIETHISWVIRQSRDVYKLKKPVDLGFLDFTTLKKRLTACEAEVELNRRMAPDVYLGVVPVTVGEDGKHRLGGEGEPVDYAVHMRRMDDSARVDNLLSAGKIGVAEIQRVAAHLASFHASARSDAETASYGTLRAIAHNVRENFEQTRDTVREHVSVSEAAELEAWQLRFLREHAERFEARAEQGRVRDGHGDLRLEHVYLPRKGGPVVLDCIEFNDRFRYADICADGAFLSMDLAWHGRVDHAERFLAAYARASNDYELYRLVDFYVSYRAYVRAKIASMVEADESLPTAVRERSAAEARRFYLLALALERRPLVDPVVVAVGGLIAAGKSTIADHVSEVMAAPVVDSDRTRKYLAGAAPTDNISTGTWTGAYSPSFTNRTYDEVLARGRAVLASGRPLILDASFRTRAMRDRARALADAYDVPFYFIECRAPAEVCRKRLLDRAAAGGSVSDGRLEIFDDFAATWEAADEVAPGHHIPLDTARPLQESLDLLRQALPILPAALTT